MLGGVLVTAVNARAGDAQGHGWMDVSRLVPEKPHRLLVESKQRVSDGRVLDELASRSGRRVLDGGGARAVPGDEGRAEETAREGAGDTQPASEAVTGEGEGARAAHEAGQTETANEGANGGALAR